MRARLCVYVGGARDRANVYVCLCEHALARIVYMCISSVRVYVCSIVKWLVRVCECVFVCVLVYVCAYIFWGGGRANGMSTPHEYLVIEQAVLQLQGRIRQDHHFSALYVKIWSRRRVV